MKVTNDLSLTHNGVSQLCSASEWFMESLSNHISQHIRECSVPESDFTSKITEMVEGNMMSFSKFSGRNYREKFYEDHFHYTVSS